MKNEDIQKNLDELKDLIDSLQWQVTELRLNSCNYHLACIEGLVQELIEEFHKSGMTDEEIKKAYFDDTGYSKLLKDFNEALLKISLSKEDE